MLSFIIHTCHHLSPAWTAALGTFLRLCVPPAVFAIETRSSWLQETGSFVPAGVDTRSRTAFVDLWETLVSLEHFQEQQLETGRWYFDWQALEGLTDDDSRQWEKFRILETCVCAPNCSCPVSSSVDFYVSSLAFASRFSRVAASHQRMSTLWNSSWSERPAESGLLRFQSL